MAELVLYTTDDGRSQIKLWAEEQPVWLTQLEKAELFDATKQNISLHLKNFFEAGELDAGAAVKESLTVQIEGSREVQLPVTRYNFDAILAVGYRVRSPRGVQFRRGESTILKEHLTNGFPLLTDSCRNGHEQMEARTCELYLRFDQERKTQEAAQAVKQDEAEFSALETKIKRRPKQ